jgi:hypothetical protein
MQGTDIGTILLLLCIILITTVNDYLLHVVEEVDRLEIQNHITIAGTPLLFFYHFMPYTSSTLVLLNQLTPPSSHLCAQDVYEYKNT